MNIYKATIVGAVCFAGTANAGTVTLSSLNNQSNWTNDYSTVHGGAFNVESVLGSTDGDATHSGYINFASSLVTVTSNDSRDFYLDDASTLGASNWFNGAPRPDSGTQVLAFGNLSTDTFSNSVTLSLDPSVRAFGFNYHDIEIGTLIINWSDGTTTQPITIDSGHGFIGLVASAGQFISSITLSQEIDVDDGFVFYGFSTIAVVPVPMAAWAGLALLVPMGIKRRMNRRD